LPPLLLILFNNFKLSRIKESTKM